MPYRWTEPETLTLTPHHALGPRGFVTFILLTVAGLALPVLTQLGHGTLWVLLVFVSATVWGLWAALQRNRRDRSITETLALTDELWTLTRRARQVQTWAANPHWIRISLHETRGPVPAYLTLTGGGREVELGAFLTPEERRALAAELGRRLTR